MWGCRHQNTVHSLAALCAFEQMCICSFVKLRVCMCQSSLLTSPTESLHVRWWCAVGKGGARKITSEKKKTHTGRMETWGKERGSVKRRMRKWEVLLRCKTAFSWALVTRQGIHSYLSYESQADSRHVVLCVCVGNVCCDQTHCCLKCVCVTVFKTFIFTFIMQFEFSVSNKEYL